MRLTFETNSTPCAFLLDIQTGKTVRMVVTAQDSIKPFTYYFRQYYDVDRNRKLKVMLPQAPDLLYTDIYNAANGNLPAYQDQTYKLEVKKVPLETRLDVFDFKKPLVRNFILFAQQFSEMAGIVEGNRNIFCYDRFRINYYDVIRDLQEYVMQDGKYIKNPKYMQEMTTPARVSRDLGIIEVSKKHFDKYTVPQRMIILLHEFSHFFYNVTKSNEEEADFNALLMYLGLGYPRIECLDIWIKVFFRVDTQQNRERYMKIKNFIGKFDDFQFKIL